MRCDALGRVAMIQPPPRLGPTCRDERGGDCREMDKTRLDAMGRFQAGILSRQARSPGHSTRVQQAWSSRRGGGTRLSAKRDDGIDHWPSQVLDKRPCRTPAPRSRAGRSRTAPRTGCRTPLWIRDQLQGETKKPSDVRRMKARGDESPLAVLVLQAPGDKGWSSQRSPNFGVDAVRMRGTIPTRSRKVTERQRTCCSRHAPRLY